VPGRIRPWLRLGYLTPRLGGVVLTTALERPLPAAMSDMPEAEDRTPRFCNIVSQTAAEAPLPAPAALQGPLMVSAHNAATLASGLYREQQNLAARKQKRNAAFDAANVKIQKTEERAAKLEESLQQVQANLDQQQEGRKAVAALDKANKANSAANTPARRQPPRNARPGDLTEDPFCRAPKDRAEGLAPPPAQCEETYEDVAPQSPMAEHLPGDLEWRLLGPGVLGPIIRAGSVLTTTTQPSYKALVVKVLEHNTRRALLQSQIAPVECVALYDVNNVRNFSVQDLPKARLLANTMRINEVLQDDKWYGEPITVEAITDVGSSLYCDQYRLPEDDAQGCAELLRQGIWIVAGALRVHKLPEESLCKRKLFSNGHGPPPDALVVVDVQRAPQDGSGNVLTHPYETTRYVGAPLPMPFVPTGQPPEAFFPGIKAHEQRVARWRMMVDACRISGSVMWAVRAQKQHLLRSLVLEWLERRARSLQPDASGTETAADTVLPSLVMADVNELLVRNGLVDGVQGRCPGVSVCLCQRAGCNDPNACRTL